MRKEQRTTGQSLVNTQTFLKSTPEVAALTDTPAAQQLDAAIVSLNAQAASQANAGLDSSVHSQRIADLATTLVQSYMKPVAQFARKSLKVPAAAASSGASSGTSSGSGSGVPDFAALGKLPRSKSGKTLSQHAHAMVNAATPVNAAFVAAKFAPDFFTKFAATADDLAAAVDARDANTARHVAATEGIRKAIKSGREAVGMLDPVVSSTLAGHELLAAWHSVKHVRKPASSTAAVTVPPAAAVVASPVVNTHAEVKPS